VKRVAAPHTGAREKRAGSKVQQSLPEERNVPDANLEGATRPPDQALIDFGILVLETDHNLTVTALHGSLDIVDPSAKWLGHSLLEVAPELAGHEAEVAALLAGEMARLALGVVRREYAEGTRYLWQETIPLRSGARIVGVQHIIERADVLGEQWERAQRQRRELAEAQQQVSHLTLVLALAQSEVKQQNDSRVQFISTAAHELRTPLASLIGYLDLLFNEDRSNLDELQTQYLRQVNRSADRLLTITNNLLDISRFDSNRIELTMQAAEPLDLLESAAGEMQPLLDAKGVRLVLNAQPGTPMVWCDWQRALQILTNLLSNAVKYTPGGGTVTLNARPMSERPFVCFSVTDTGIGIPPEDQDRVFGRFFRARNAASSGATGAGLGLAVTQSLARLHGGKVWFESRAGKGSTFFVTFPVVEQGDG
jgi:signal transduction histidine kinase